MGQSSVKTSHDRTSYGTPYLHLILVFDLGLIGTLQIGFVSVFARTHGSICSIFLVVAFSTYFFLVRGEQAPSLDPSLAGFLSPLKLNNMLLVRIINYL